MHVQCACATELLIGLQSKNKLYKVLKTNYLFQLTYSSVDFFINSFSEKSDYSKYCVYLK